MKTIFTVAMVAVLGASLFTSCSKNNNSSAGSNYCICAYKTVKGHDSTQLAYYGYAPNFSNAAAAKQCGLEQDTLQAIYPGITCAIENP